MKKQTEKTWGGYDLIRTSRKTIAIQITLDGDVTVRAPRDCEKAEIDDLIRDRREWIEEKRAEFLAQKRECEKKQEQFPKITPESEREFRRLAKEKIPKRVQPTKAVLSPGFPCTWKSMLPLSSAELPENHIPFSAALPFLPLHSSPGRFFRCLQEAPLCQA